MEKHEVVIVGAGPGGLKAAELLGKAGKDVLVIEKNPEKRIGDKPCAGAFPSHGWHYIPEDLLERNFDSIVLYMGQTKTRMMMKRAFLATISRKKLGQYQLKEAKETGVEFRCETKVTGIDKDKKEVKADDNTSITYEYLIGADGSNSVVSRSLGFKNPAPCNCIEYEIPGEFEDFEVCFDLKRFGLTYSWLFPHEGYASIGTGTFTKLHPASEMYGWLGEWCTEKGIDLTKHKPRAHPINFSYNGFRHGDIFLTGDAASFVCTFTAEGIYQAIKSGEIAANAIIDPKYNWKRDVRDLLRYHRIAWWALSLLNSFPSMERKIIEDAGGKAMPILAKGSHLLFSFETISNAVLSWLWEEP
jgi:geranylgeranyl reductase